GFGGGFGFEWLKMTGDPLQFTSGGLQIQDAEAKISIVPLYLFGAYRINNNKNAMPYFGFGLGLFLVKESLEMTVYDPYSNYSEHYYDEVSDNAFGIQIFSGIQLNFVYFELKYSYGAIDGEGGAGGESVDVGGVTISGGFKF
ncbi:MAG: hypothetical protein K8S00_12940, partial [Bacteroidales bacterium]|nr:hypothetical protein [Bacteroidales bacterium]